MRPLPRHNFNYLCSSNIFHNIYCSRGLHGYEIRYSCIADIFLRITRTCIRIRATRFSTQTRTRQAMKKNTRVPETRSQKWIEKLCVVGVVLPGWNRLKMQDTTQKHLQKVGKVLATTSFLPFYSSTIDDHTRIIFNPLL